MEKTIELKINEKDIVLIKGRKVLNVEQFIKVNEKGEQVLLKIEIPVEHIRTKTLKLTINVEDTQFVKNDSKISVPIKT